MLKQFKDKFEADSKNILAQNVCNKHDLWEICKQQNVVWEQPHIFNNKVHYQMTYCLGLIIQNPHFYSIYIQIARK